MPEKPDVPFVPEVRSYQAGEADGFRRGYNAGVVVALVVAYVGLVLAGVLYWLFR